MRVTKWAGILGFVLLLALGGSWPLIAGAAAPLMLVPAPSSPLVVGVGVNQFFVGDLNGDGTVDLIAGDANTRRGHGAVFVGRGDGAFVPAPVPPVAVIGRAVDEFGGDTALADVSGDGRLDLVAVCRDGVAVQRGRGDGTFALAALPFDTCGLTFFLVDVNRDGMLDVVTQVSATVYRGRGDGTFGPAEISVSDRTLFTVRAVRDLDGDRMPDLYVPVRTYPTFEAVTYRGNGNGTFTRADLPTTAVPDTLRADVDGDGIADRLQGGVDHVFVGRGRGNGTFEPYVPVSTTPPCMWCEVFVLGDTNGDGIADFGVGDATRGTLTVFVIRPAPAPLGRVAAAPSGSAPVVQPPARTVPQLPAPQPPRRAAAPDTILPVSATPLPLPAPPRR